MTRHRNLSLITVLALLPGVHHAQAQQTPSAAPWRVLASFSGRRNDDEAPSHNGRWLLRSVGKELSVYDVARKSSSRIADMRAWEISWSPRDDAAVFVRGDDNGEGDYVWYVPIDESTGKPRGTPRRVTPGQANSPSISSDGRFIAYSARDSGNAFKLAVVPAAGGKERIVARLASAVESIHWSADDKFLFFGGMLPGKPARYGVLKVSVAGGVPQLIGPEKVWLAGMTRDQQHLVTVPSSSPVKATDRAVVIDVDGHEVSRAPLPVGEISEYAGVIGDTALVWVQAVNHKTISVREPGGAIRRLASAGRSDLFPHWAPDGRRIAFVDEDGVRRSIAVADASGGNPTTFAGTDVRIGEWAMSWSPDSRLIAYETPDQHSVWLLDVASGKSRRIFVDTAYTPGLLTWTADGRALRFSAGRAQSSWTGSVWEARIDGGTPKELSRLSGLTGITLVGPGSVLVRDDSIASLLTLATGARERIAAIEPHTRIWTVGVAPDHATIAAVITPDSGRQRNQLEILSIAQHARRTLDLPFIVDASVHFPVFAPAGTSVFLFGKSAGDSTTKLYEVPLSGGNPRVVADIGSEPRDASVSASATGRMAFTSQAGPTGYNLLIVPLFAPLGKAASRRAPR